MEHSSFANPNRLDHEDHYSTARDMARLACAAVENETLVRMASTRARHHWRADHDQPQQAVEPDRGVYRPEDRLYHGGRPDAGELCGAKRPAAGGGDSQDGNDWADHAALYDYGFSTYPAKLGASLGQTIQRVQVENGMSATVPLVAADSFAWPLAEGVPGAGRGAGRISAGPHPGRPAGREAVFSVNGKRWAGWRCCMAPTWRPGWRAP